jgi:hypothetical protein
MRKVKTNASAPFTALEIDFTGQQKAFHPTFVWNCEADEVAETHSKAWEID